MSRQLTVFMVVVYLVSTTPAFAGTFRDNFEDGNFEGWQASIASKGKWEVGNGELIITPEGMVSTALFIGEAGWSDYTLQTDVMVVKVLIPQ